MKKKSVSIKKNRKLLFAAVAVIALFAVLSSTVSNGAAAFAHSGAVSWGLKPNTQEKTPVPPADGVKLLTEHGGLFVGDTAQKKVYFTFDLGYEAGYTAEVLDILKENGIKGVFFLCGNYLKETELVKRMISEGHSIGNHTDRHKDLPKLSDEGIKKDIAAFYDYGGGQTRIHIWMSTGSGWSSICGMCGGDMLRRMNGS